jgi:hypothetical protein
MTKSGQYEELLRAARELLVYAEIADAAGWQGVAAGSKKHANAALLRLEQAVREASK